MPQTCTICTHPQRLQIERALVAGTSVRDIAGQYGPSKTAIGRHRTHVVESIARSREAKELVRTGALLDDVRAGEQRAEDLYANAQEILNRALKDNDGRTALQAIRTAVSVMGEARGYMELRGELTSELGRDKAPTPYSIQIIVPTALTAGQLPRVSFAPQDAVDSDPDEGMPELGLLQRP